MPEIAKLGPLFKSSDKPSDLTESETEYVVQCVKHTFAEHVVFQVSLLSLLCLHKCTDIWVHAYLHVRVCMWKTVQYMYSTCCMCNEVVTCIVCTCTYKAKHGIKS